MSKKGNKAPELSIASTEPVDIEDLSDPKETKLKEEEKADATKDTEDLKESKEAKDTKNSKATKDTEVTEEVPLNEESGKTVEKEEEEAPPQPPRPVDPITRITNDLKEAFPSVEDKLITAVLIASQGHVDPAFNALLYISDPSFKPEIPTPVSASAPASALKSSGGAVNKKSVAFSNDQGLTDDELLARKLQKEFELEDERRRRRHQEKKRQQQRKQAQSQDVSDSPDEFEQIKETFTNGLEEARSTLNSWVTGLARKFDGDDSRDSRPSPPPKQNPKLFGALGGSSFDGDNRRNTSRFDEDPQIISHDFHNRISMTDNDKGDLPALPARSREQSDTPKGAAGKKWQPLNSDVPANSDAFLVTDSEEEEGEDRKKPN